MVKFTMEQLRRLMKCPENIRNISVIAHVDHGKTTLTDSLLAKCGLINKDQAGNVLSTDTLKQEKDRGITIKSTSISLYFQRPSNNITCQPTNNTDNNNNNINNINNDEYLIHLIDCPGHVDFSSEVTSSLRVTDGALVVVDCIEGVCVQTETVLRQAISENIECILFLNKIDRIFLELKPDLNEIYDTFEKAIHSVNTVIQTYYPAIEENKDNKDNSEEVDLLPQNGKVGFGSGLHAWGFTIKDFADMYSSRFGVSPKKLMTKLWGDNYFDPIKSKWVKDDNNGTLERGFVQFILRPLKLLIDSIMDGKSNVYNPIINNLGIMSRMNQNDLSSVRRPKDLLKIVMKTWLPAGDTLLDMIVNHLPNPIQAQSYRMDKIYSGPLDSKEATILRDCDINAPMTFYVSKMVPTKDFSRFIAFGRVFSGTIKAGQEIMIVNEASNNNNDVNDTNNDENERKISVKKCKVQKVLVMMGKSHDSVNEVSCGNVCGILGIDEYLNKSGTLVEANNNYHFMPFKVMNYNVSPIVQIAVNCKKASELPKLIDALKKLEKFDNLVRVKQSETGEKIICGAGELHLETCLETLQTLFLHGSCELKINDPIVSYNETITGQNENMPSISVSKSANKLNRLYCNAESLTVNDETRLFIKELEDNNVEYLNIIKNKDGLKQLQNNLTKKYPNYWGKEHINDIKNIWSFGSPDVSMTNVLCDLTKGQQLMKDIKSDVISAFEQTTKYGVLCNEPLRGVKVNLLDAKIHSDKSHRNAAAIIPCMKRVVYACEIANNPRLMEPIYSVEIVANKSEMGAIYNTFTKRRGYINTFEEKVGTPLAIYKGQLPVSESFGFTQELRSNTGGKAFPSMQFSHWEIMEQDPYLMNSNNSNNKPTKNTLNAANIIFGIRQRKGMKLELPKFNDYYDKIN